MSGGSGHHCHNFPQEKVEGIGDLGDDSGENDAVQDPIILGYEGNLTAQNA